MGRQLVRTLINFLSYWVLALSTSYFLAFHFGWGLYGLWGGMLIGVSFQASAFTVTLMAFTDWAQEASNARCRSLVSSTSGPMGESCVEGEGDV